eukprot:1374960-Pleurochrysis_carterae.AAC.1
MCCAQPGRRKGARAAPLVVSSVVTTTGTNAGAHEALAKERARRGAPNRKQGERCSARRCEPVYVYTEPSGERCGGRVGLQPEE